MEYFHEYQENGWLSALSAHGFEHEGKWWPTAEHMFQAKKFEGTETEEQIRTTPNVRRAIQIGRRSRGLRPDWEQVKLDVFRLAFRLKFQAHPELTQKLIDTGNEEITKNCRDPFWGKVANAEGLSNGRSRRCEIGSGSNHQGEILMEIRREAQLRSCASGFLESYNDSLQDIGERPYDWEPQHVEYAIQAIIADTDFREVWEDVVEMGGVGRIERDLIFLVSEAMEKDMSGLELIPASPE